MVIIIFNEKLNNLSNNVKSIVIKGRLSWEIYILYWIDANSCFLYQSFQPVLYDWCNKGCGMCYPVCGMVHIKEPLLLIGNNSLCGGSGFPFPLSEWSSTIIMSDAI